jgi:hypothetical protein
MSTDIYFVLEKVTQKEKNVYKKTDLLFIL